MKVQIIPVGEVPRELLQELAPRLVKAYRPLIEDCAIGPPLEIPPAAHDLRRRQYSANRVLEHVLHRTAGEQKVLAITNVDLFVPRLNFVFGLAQSPGTVALISIHRLDPVFYGRQKDRVFFLERTAKEAIHELGHTFGLGHCSDAGCVMSFSNSIPEVDAKSSDFCERCLRKLEELPL